MELNMLREGQQMIWKWGIGKYAANLGKLGGSFILDWDAKDSSTR